ELRIELCFGKRKFPFGDLLAVDGGDHLVILGGRRTRKQQGRDERRAGVNGQRAAKGNGHETNSGFSISDVVQFGPNTADLCGPKRFPAALTSREPPLICPSSLRPQPFSGAFVRPLEPSRPSHGRPRRRQSSFRKDLGWSAS